MNTLKKFLIVLTVLIMEVNMTSCININSGIKNTTISQLENKYNCNFEVTHIGNRLNYSTGTLFLKDSDDIYFSAVTDSKTSLVEDDYIRQRVVFQFKSIILDRLAKNDINANISSVIMCKIDCSEERDKNITLQDFISKYKVDEISTYICIEESNLNEKNINLFYEILKEQSTKLGIAISCSIFNIATHSYNDCSKQMSLNPDINNTWFDQFSPISNAMFCVENSIIVPDEKKLSKLLLQR